jgi:hypothetical protein
MTGEQLGREQKAKKLARYAISRLVAMMKDCSDSDWARAAALAGCSAEPSEAIRKRVIEILSEVAI